MRSADIGLRTAVLIMERWGGATQDQMLLILGVSDSTLYQTENVVLNCRSLDLI